MCEGFEKIKALSQYKKEILCDLKVFKRKLSKNLKRKRRLNWKERDDESNLYKDCFKKVYW